MQLNTVIANKIKNKQIKRKSTFHLPYTTSISSLPQHSSLLPKTLTTQAQAWGAISRLSSWVLNTIKHGYLLQFASRPPHFRGVICRCGAKCCMSSVPKDAYFHIKIAPHHRPFLRFEGVAYQYTVLPFGMSLAQCTFTKCMDVALSSLRQKGVRILNYLDDWLILG